MKFRFFTFGFNWSESFPIKKYYMDYHGTSWHTIYPCVQVMDIAFNAPLRYVRPSVGISVWIPESELKIDGKLLDTAVSLYLCATTAIPDFPVQAGLGFRTAPNEYKKYGVNGALTFSVGFDAVWIVVMKNGKPVDSRMGYMPKDAIEEFLNSIL